MRATCRLLGAEPREVRDQQTSEHQRINIHGAIHLETGQARMIEALTIDVASTIRLLQSIEALYPMLALIDVSVQRALSSCQARAGMVGLAGTTHQAALHPTIART